jgi:protein-S-isoprenylcysteine O-methyltransferase Ste14
MTEATIYTYLIWAMFGFAAVTFVILMFITAPFGRHVEDGWGPTVPNKLGWVVMESPSVFFFAGVFIYGGTWELVPLVFLGLWQLHYIQRTFVFPFITRSTTKRMPLLVVVAAFGFNTLNSYLNARWISHFGSYAIDWLSDPRFIIGVILFVTGFAINVHADRVLINLRKPGETEYKIPRGGLYKWVTSPNYLGEFIEWFGWALATWSLAGLGFAVYTVANLLPRALSNHEWYHEKFDDYPEERKAVIPFLI